MDGKERYALRHQIMEEMRSKSEDGATVRGLINMVCRRCVVWEAMNETERAGFREAVSCAFGFAASHDYQPDGDTGWKWVPRAGYVSAVTGYANRMFFPNGDPRFNPEENGAQDRAEVFKILQFSGDVLTVKVNERAVWERFVEEYQAGTTPAVRVRFDGPIQNGMPDEITVRPPEISAPPEVKEKPRPAKKARKRRNRRYYTMAEKEAVFAEYAKQPNVRLLAEKLGVPRTSIMNWRRRYRWNERLSPEKAQSVRTWNRYTDEDRREAFGVYRDLGPGRRSHLLTAQKLGIAPATVSGWAREDGWAEKVRKHDDAMEAAQDSKPKNRKRFWLF